MLTAKFALFLLGAAVAGAAELLVCGGTEAYILDMEASPPERVWEWRAGESPGLPRELAGLFRHLDECKPVEGGGKILLTASSNGVALVERSTRRTLFHAAVENAHSAAMLPDGFIAVAASHRPGKEDDRLVLFDSSGPSDALEHDPLPYGHGAVWDARRGVLWALAGSEVRSYTFAPRQTPRLIRRSAHPLPSPGGHDLYPAGGDLLAVTTSDRCFLFDRESGTFAPHPLLGDTRQVKSLAHEPGTGRVAFIRAEGGTFSASTIRFLNPESALPQPGPEIYKARWMAEPD